MARELLDGTLDKFGNTRDNEKRAVLVALDRLLAFVPAVHRQFETLDAKKKEQEDKLKERTGIHGDDVLMGTGQRGVAAGWPDRR